MSADIRTPDQGIRVFVSSTLQELAQERLAVREAIESVRLVPVMFELGARPHPPSDTYRAYLRQSHLFIGIYGASYGWIAPGARISGLEDELRLSAGMPQLLYIKAHSHPVDHRLQAMLDDVAGDGHVTYRRFDDSQELGGLVRRDLSTLVAERFLADVTTASPVDAPPTASTPTVGRDTELHGVAQLIRGHARIVTITGPGGIGKSRLALEAAADLAADFPDGVAFTALEDVTDPAHVLSSVARSVHTPDSGNRPQRDALVERLAGRRMLLVIDNMEQVAAAGPELADVLDHSPGVVALVTSRQPLHLRGEHEFLIGPLTVPDSARSDDLASVPAVALFLQRAHAIRPGYRPTADELDAIAELCRRLDGIPLAIELAAARTRLLTPRQLLERLSGHLDVLGGGAVDLPVRQQTMRATLDWSYHLLEDDERALLARCSVFAGATIDAIDAVCVTTPGTDTIALLTSLVDKNLVVAELGSDPGGRRVRMLQTVRSYAAERLDELGATASTRARHARWYADLAAPADPLIHAHATRHWPTLELEIGNLRHAADAALEQLDYPVLVDLGRRLWTWLRNSGRIPELRATTDRVLDNIPGDIDAASAAALYDIAAYVTGLCGDLRGGQALAARALDAVRHAQGDDADVLAAHAHLTHALIVSASAAPEAVDRELGLVIDIARSRRNRWLVANATSARGMLAALGGDTDTARRHLTETLHAAIALDHPVLVSQANSLLALTDIVDQRPADARCRLRRAADDLTRTGNLEGLANALDIVAALANARHRWTDATTAASTAAALRTTIAIPPWPLVRQYHDDVVEIARRHLERGHDPPATTDAIGELRRQLAAA